MRSVWTPATSRLEEGQAAVGVDGPVEDGAAGEGGPGGRVPLGGGAGAVGVGVVHPVGLSGEGQGAQVRGGPDRLGVPAVGELVGHVAGRVAGVGRDDVVAFRAGARQGAAAQQEPVIESVSAFSKQ